MIGGVAGSAGTLGLKIFFVIKLTSLSQAQTQKNYMRE